MIKFVVDLFYSPIKIFWICLGIIIFVIVSDGSLFRLWNLYQDQKRIAQNLEKLDTDFKVLDNQFQKANDPEFLEHQARNRLDLASEDELIFVFSDN